MRLIPVEGCEDVNLAWDMWAGFNLVGTSSVSNVPPGKVTPASLHPDDLCAGAAPRANEALKTSLGLPVTARKMSSCVRLCKKWLWGWLIGPYQWEPIPAGADPLNDYSCSGVNACVTTLEQPTEMLLTCMDSGAGL